MPATPPVTGGSSVGPVDGGDQDSKSAGAPVYTDTGTDLTAVHATKISDPLHALDNLPSAEGTKLLNAALEGYGSAQLKADRDAYRDFQITIVTKDYQSRGANLSDPAVAAEIRQQVDAACGARDFQILKGLYSVQTLGAHRDMQTDVVVEGLSLGLDVQVDKDTKLPSRDAITTAVLEGKAMDLLKATMGPNNPGSAPFQTKVQSLDAAGQEALAHKLLMAMSATADAYKSDSAYANALGGVPTEEVSFIDIPPEFANDRIARVIYLLALLGEKRLDEVVKYTDKLAADNKLIPDTVDANNKKIPGAEEKQRGFSLETTKLSILTGKVNQDMETLAANRRTLQEAAKSAAGG